MTTHDYDWLVIGSGFGGSVGGTAVGGEGLPGGGARVRPPVRRRGLRRNDVGAQPVLLDAKARPEGDLPADAVPGRVRRVGVRCRRRVTRLRQHAVPGAPGVLRDPQWRGLADWERELAPHYDTAERMLGVTDVRRGFTGRHTAAAEYAERERLRRHVRAHPGRGVPRRAGRDGATTRTSTARGPARTGCVRCGSCMVGCRHGAKNTLVKNYLHFAERLGVEILPERDRRRHPPARRRRRLGRVRGTRDELRRLGAKRPPAADRRGRGRRSRSRSAPTGCCSAANWPAHCRESRTVSVSWCGPTASRSSR